MFVPSNQNNVFANSYVLGESQRLVENSLVCDFLSVDPQGSTSLFAKTPRIAKVEKHAQNHTVLICSNLEGFFAGLETENLSRVVFSSQVDTESQLRLKSWAKIFHPEIQFTIVASAEHLTH
jgi:hypothetical protein